MRLQKTTVLAASILTAGALFAAVPAQAESQTVTLRQTDVDLTSTRDTGHVDFLESGLHVWTESNTSTDKAAAYWQHTGALPDTSSIGWIGTDPAASVQLKFDVDGITGNGNDSNTLVYEADYYGDNYWLTPGSSDQAKAADPSGTENGGNGSEWFGTLAEWKAALPDARMTLAGFSLGSGVKGDGYIDNVTIGETVYKFTGTPVAEEPTVFDVRGTHRTQVTGNWVRIDMRSWRMPEGNYTEGNKLTWHILVDGRTALKNEQGFEESDFWTERFRARTGAHRITLVKNGQVVKNFLLRTNR